MYWKTLPREEREVWEAKALVAQAEHRKRYPDWRFRPGANALAKLKVKDGPGTNKRRNSNSGTSTRKQKGEMTEVKEKSDEKRCAKIADFLVEGKKGLDLEAALKEWEGNVQRETKVKGWKGNVVKGVKEMQGSAVKDSGSRRTKESATSACPAGETTPEIADASTSACKSDLQPRCLTPDVPPDHRFKVPLTAMFKRSLSAPASQTCSPCPLEEAEALYSTRRGSSASFDSSTSSQLQLSSPFPYETASVSMSPMSPFPPHEAIPRAVAASCGGVVDDISSDCLSPLTLSPVLERGTLAAHWSDVSLTALSSPLFALGAF